jgi:pyruvate kinase
MTTETHLCNLASDDRMSDSFEKIDEAIAVSAMYMANHADMTGIAALTETGSTPLWMSRISSGIPIFAFSSHEDTLGRVTLYRGVFPIPFPHEAMSTSEANQKIIDRLRNRGLIEQGDTFIITKGDTTGNAGGTNSLKVITVGQGQIK